MKSQFSTLVVLSLIATTSMAQTIDKESLENKIQNSPVENFEYQIFEVAPDKPMQLAELSTTEMKETEGAWGPVGAIIGGIGGGAGYFLNQQIAKNQFSPTTLAWAVGTGPVAGATTGPAGVVWGFNSSLAGGMITGVAQHYGK